jgi:hypothetical protein
MRRDSCLRLAAHTPIRAHLDDGTSNCLRTKGPILRDAMPKGSQFLTQNPFANPASLKQLTQLLDNLLKTT